RRSSAGMLARAQIDGKGDFTVLNSVPSKSLQLMVVNCSDLQALPGEWSRLPEGFISSESADGLEIGKEQNFGLNHGADFQDRLRFQKMPFCGVVRIHQICVSA